MNRPHRSFSSAMMMLMFTALTASACKNVTPAVREFTYPPDFNYLSAQELRSSMERLAYQLQKLDEALVKGANGEPTQQQNVLERLENIERIGASLQTSGSNSTHPFLNNFMSDFRKNVRQAHHAASMKPPEYYLAGTVAGGCVNCHKVNRQ